MASRQAGQSLKQVARALEKVPDDAVRDAAEAVVDEARRRGGTFGAKRGRLGARIKTNKRGSVTVLGVSAGAWAIKSYGRVRSEARDSRHPLGVKGGTFHATHARGTRGDGRWDRVREYAEDQSPRVVAEAVAKAMRV